MMFLLIDCNNFYASCEQIFNPALENKAVAILSNNDGCIIARSKEAKKLGLEMGAPAFMYKKWEKEKKVIFLSSNFPLYADMSQRVMEIVQGFSFPIEIYSIDEAFVEVNTMDISFLHELAKLIRKRILHWIGIPVSIGLGKTKTLAKIASEKAKANNGIFLIDEKTTALQTIPIEDVWGIGKRLSKKLHAYKILTAFDLIQKDPYWIRKVLSVNGLRTAMELKGEKVFSIDNTPSSKKSILCSRSFSTPIRSRKELEEKISMFAARAAEKLRKQECVAGAINVYIRSSPYEENFYANHSFITLFSKTLYTPELIEKAKLALHRIYKENISYKSAGVILLDIEKKKSAPIDFFTSTENVQKKEVIMKIVDSINKNYSKNALFFLAQGNQNLSSSKEKKNLSKKYTTSWKELLVISI